MASDVRGGDTDVGRQLQMILGHPWAYIQILFENIKNTFNSYMMGIDSISTMAYEGIFEFYMVVTALVLGVACTEPRKVMSRTTNEYIQSKHAASCCRCTGSHMDRYVSGFYRSW